MGLLGLAPSGVHAGEEDLLREDSGGDEEGRAEELDSSRVDLDARFLLDLERRPGADTRFAAVLRLEQAGDDLLDVKVRTLLGDSHLQVFPEVSRRPEVLAGEHLEAGLGVAVDQHRHRVEPRAVDDIDPVHRRPGAVRAAIPAAEPSNLEKPFIAAGGGRKVLDHLDVGHGCRSRRHPLPLEFPKYARIARLETNGRDPLGCRALVLP